MLPSVDRTLLRLTGNRYSLTSLLTGLPIITLTTTGARSGQRRSVPLVALEEGDRLILIASNFGQTRQPAWYYNLRANPEALVTLRGEQRWYVAREATTAERQRYWSQAIALYAGYAAYETRAQNRVIPILVLTPKE